MEITKSDIVLSVAGRDRGKLFYVLETDGVYVLVANGKERRLEHPKRKKLKQDVYKRQQLHEEPEVRNFGAPGHGPRMLKGMTLAIEPMVNQGSYEVVVLRDKWTTVTADGSLSAHYENTVLITDGEPEILTVTEGL